MAPSAVKRKRPDASGGLGPAKAGPSKLQSRSKGSRVLKRRAEEEELKALNDGVAALTSTQSLAHFDQLPLSAKTRAGLARAAFIDMTDIQAKSLPLTLKGKDLLGAARTGSGKTLAFLIPVLERLHRAKWGPSDGLGALIISPTRELAIQIFDVLRKIGGGHTFSAGLVIGGKDLKQERDRLARMNILVATPGRLLQHMDQTLGFDASSIQILVLDEADRILDMGFANTLDAIVENLPKEGRQTLLFSATQTKRVKDLARLSLSSPEYVAVRDAEGESSTPKNLSQHCMIVPLEKKLDMLFSFVRTHLKNKVLVFLSSCRQVQFVHETFCKLRPGVSLLCLHGKQKQTKRLQIFQDFTRTQHAVLFATDVAARGLDFPAVDWVIQVDAPEDAETYIHRVGRTARYQASGNSLLFLLPSEEAGVVKRLETKGIHVDKIKARESKTQSISNQLQSFLFQDPQLKYLGQKAFVSYVRSIHLQRDKATFDVTALPLEAFASTLGLPGAPKVKFVKEAQAAKKKALKMFEKERAAGGAEEREEDDSAPAKVRTKYDRMFERKNQGVLSEHYSRLVADDSGEESEGDGSDENDGSDVEDAKESRGAAFGRRTAKDSSGSESDDSDAGDQLLDDNAADDGDDFLTLKRADHDLEDGTAHPTDSHHLSKRKIAQGQSKRAMALAGKRGQGEKLNFDDDGVPHAIYELKGEADFNKGSVEEMQRRFVEEEQGKLRERDAEDKERVRERRKEKKRREKERRRGARESDDEDEGDGDVAYLAPVEDDGYESPDFGDLAGGESGGESDDDHQEAPRKKQRSQPTNVQADEELALRLLGA